MRRRIAENGTALEGALPKVGDATTMGLASSADDAPPRFHPFALDHERARVGRE
jgi:hypothetical protein